MNTNNRGDVAEWLRNCLQNSVHQFNSGHLLQCHRVQALSLGEYNVFRRNRSANLAQPSNNNVLYEFEIPAAATADKKHLKNIPTFILSVL